MLLTVLLPPPSPSEFTTLNNPQAALEDGPWTGSNLHVEDLLECVSAAVSQKLDVIVHKHNWGLMWSHHHLPRQGTRDQTKNRS